MARFDILRSTGAPPVSIPSVAVVQSTRLDGYRAQMMVPLRGRAALRKRSRTANTCMNPVIRTKKTHVVLHRLDVLSVAVEQLDERVVSLAEHGQAIIDTLDELLTR